MLSQTPGGEPISIVLEPRDAEGALMHWGLNVQPESTPFAGEPDAGKDTVLRQSLNLVSSERKPLPFLWNVTRGTLHFDLNRNRNLGDDPQGRYTNTSRGYYQEYKDVLLPWSDSSGVRTQRVNLDLANPGGGIQGYAAQRTYWQGKLTLDGKDYQIGIVESLLGGDSIHSLLLRPWEAREKPFSLMDGSRDAFAFAPHLFFAGRAFNVIARTEPGPAGSRYRLDLQPQTPALGELRLTGTHLGRLILRGQHNTVVLDHPPSSVRLPVDIYTQVQAQLAAGSLVATRSEGFAPNLNVTDSKPAVLATGGPLTNHVTLRRRGGMLVLNYQLLGADGAPYQLDTTDRNPPQFKVRQDNRELATGGFQYG